MGIDTEEVRIPVRVDEKELEQGVRKTRRRLDDTERRMEREQKSGKRGGKRSGKGAALAGLAGGFLGFLLGTAATTLVPLLDLVANLIAISLLPIIRFLLPFIPKVQSFIEDTVVPFIENHMIPVLTELLKFIGLFFTKEGREKLKQGAEQGGRTAWSVGKFLTQKGAEKIQEKGTDFFGGILDNTFGTKAGNAYRDLADPDHGSGVGNDRAGQAVGNSG